MLVIFSLALLHGVISAPRMGREMNADSEHLNKPLALNITRLRSAPNALFIPHGEEPHGFDPRKPIQGAFFVSDNTEPLNQAQFRFPQRTLIANRAMISLSPPPDSATTTSPLSSALAHEPPQLTPTNPSVPDAMAMDSQNVEQQETVAISSLVSAADELVTTTEAMMPSVVVDAGQNTASPSTPQPVHVASNIPPVDKNVDLDGDGQLSLPEVQYAAFVHHGLSSNVVQGLFNEVDHNKDGFLNSVEFDNIRPLVLAKAENAALRYMQSVDTDKNKMLSLEEAQAYILKEHGIGSRDVERVWRLVNPSTSTEMDALQFSKLRRRIRGMTIRLARQIMKIADINGDGHISLDEAQAIAFEQEGIGAGDVAQIFASVDDNNDGELNAPEFADFERIVRSRAVETSKKALRVVDIDGSNTLTMDEGRRIAFEHYGFNENDLAPFFDQADENEDGHLDAVEFAGFRSVIRNKAVRNAVAVLKESDLDGDGLLSLSEAEQKTKREDDMDAQETTALFNIADQGRSFGKLDKVELADFIRLVRLSAIRFATDHFKEFDTNRDHLVTVDELAQLIENKYHVPFEITKMFFHKVDVDSSGDLIPAEIVDFRHEIRKYVTQHPLSFVEQDTEERNSVENDVDTTTRRRIVSSTTTIAPVITTTKPTTTRITLSTSPIPKVPKRISTTGTSTTGSTSTTSTTSKTSTTTKAATSSELARTVAQSNGFPTLLPSTRRKVPFRQQRTSTPQTNDIEELFVGSSLFKGDSSHPEFLLEKDSIEKSNGHSRKVWKNQRFTTIRSTSVGVTDTPSRIQSTSPHRLTVTVINSLTSQRPNIPVTVPTTSTENQRLQTKNQNRMTTRTTAQITTTALHSTSTTTTPVIPTTSPYVDVEYEEVEVEVDDNGNEILSEPIEVTEESNDYKNRQDEQIEGEVLRSTEDESEDDIQRKSKRMSLAQDLVFTNANDFQVRRKLVKEQKRALNLPDSIEVEYLDSETSKRPDDVEIVDAGDYSDEKVGLQE